MKNFLFAAILTGFAGLPLLLKAQDVIEKKEIELEKVEKDRKPGKRETQEIIIRNKGDKDMKLKVEINGEDITVNGKPLNEFIDKNISINKRKMVIREGDKMMQFDFGEGPGGFDFGKNFNYNFNMDDADVENNHKAFLGVTTEAASGGVKVVGVSKGSAAEKAGIKKEDIITRVGNEKITSPEGLADVIAFKKPNDEVKVTYKRDGKEVTSKVILGNKKQSITRNYSFSAPQRPPLRGNRMPQLAPLPNMEGFNEDVFELQQNAMENAFPRQKKIGLKLQDTEEGGNVKVINVEDSSAAAIAGLKKDDLITEINGNKINNTDDAREELVPEEDRKSYRIKVNRNGTEMLFDVKIPRKLKTANF